MAASATFAFKAGVWFRRGRLDMVSPDSQATACLPSGRNSTYRLVQISATGSVTGCPYEVEVTHPHLGLSKKACLPKFICRSDAAENCDGSSMGDDEIGAD